LEERREGDLAWCVFVSLSLLSPSIPSSQKTETDGSRVIGPVQNSLDSLTFTPSQNRLQFVSGADEKIVRVFDAPGVFLSSLKKLSGVEFAEGEKEGRPLAANVPPLGLSNRAVASASSPFPFYARRRILTKHNRAGSEEAEQLQPASNDPFEAVAAVDFTVTEHPPLEEQLLGSTLWPEVRLSVLLSFSLLCPRS
jgi:elongator complex protein 2